jgi:DNA recombination protein RmuC
MTEVLIALLGLLLGGGIGAILARRASQRAQAALAAELEEERRAHAAVREELARAAAARDALEAARADEQARRRELEASFRALAAEALKSSNEQFLQLARETFAKTEHHHVQELAKREKAIEHLVKPLGEGLEKLGKFTTELEQKRQEAYGGLNARLEQLMASTVNLDRHSNALATALCGSAQARGRWGEIALRNIVEFAGMTEHCDFVEQETDHAGNRPDLVVRLPGGGRIPVDAKVPFADYEKAHREEDPALRAALLDAHAAALRDKIRELARKDYAAQLDGKVDFTVMFVPTEPILSAALERNPDLYSEALAKKVLPATPVTLIALLRTVGVYWQQERMAENAEHIWVEAKELQKRLIIFAEHLARIRKGLVAALEGYNDAIGSYRGRILPQGRKIEELGAVADDQRRIEAIEEIEVAVREIPETG